MNTVVVRRPPRADGPPMPEGEVELQEPPVLGEPPEPDMSSLFMFLPMGLGVAAMALMFSMGSGASPFLFLMGGTMGLAMVCMTLGQVVRAGSERNKKMRAERRDYLRYLAQLRRRARRAAEEQQAAVLWDNPDLGKLWTIAGTPRMWERRPGHPDFGRVRIGIGARSAALEFAAPQTKPVEDLEPLSAISLRRFTRAYRTVSDLPISVGMRSFTSIEFEGDGNEACSLIRAMLGQLVTFHSPDELRIAVLADEHHRGSWDWIKWLPHCAHPSEHDQAGALRLFAGDHEALLDVLGSDLADRGDHDKSAQPSAGEPLLVVVAHGAQVPEESRLHGAGLRNVVLLDATGELPGGPKVLRLKVAGGAVEFVAGDETASVRADALGLSAIDTLSRVLAPYRTGGMVDLTDEALEADFDLVRLLGLRDVHGFDVEATWRGRLPLRSRLQVPIGVTEAGEVVELDLKESAQGGMGPHGLVIGATGSGKSELLRTLVLGLAATHSSQILNFVLVDFKGGATFLGLDALPHTSAVITNLADELPLVDRMQDSIGGEMIRRQELLRESGYSSLLEYEKARAAGQQLAPLPTLVIVVDEFSELLTSKPDFIELFIMIGRLGRSLGVHLLLASQRLDEGRIHRLESHLSYRIALRTFSSMESRSVIGVSKAYELPSAPGNGYLKVDNATLVRFKAAYVSGPCPPPAEGLAAETSEQAAREVVRFEVHPRPMTQRLLETVPEPLVDQAGDAAEAEDDNLPSLLEVLTSRLSAVGSVARQVWLPPLTELSSLDSLFPGIEPDMQRGLMASAYQGTGRMRVPLGMVDLPHEQRRELLMVDLSGADGHVGVAGAAQTGKSTLLRTLVLSLALTHTPREVQFYALDFGGGGLAALAGLPHVGSVASRLDRDRVLRTVEELAQLSERREATFGRIGVDSMASYRQARARGEVDDPYGDVFLLVDGAFTLRQDFADLEQRIQEIGARGLNYGIHLIVSAARWSEIRPSLRDTLGTKLELRLGDAMESEHGSRKNSTIPQQPGRGLTGNAAHFLSALPRLDGGRGTDDLTTATKSAVEEIATFWTGESAPSVRLLPGMLPASRLPTDDGEKLCLGWDENRLGPVWHDFGSTPHLMVFGDTETGKTNLLRLVIRHVTGRYGPDEAKLLLGDSERELYEMVPEPYRIGYAISTETLAELSTSAAVSLQKRLPGADIAPERLKERDWWTGPKLFMLVDDYDLLAPGGVQSPLEPMLPLLARGVNISMHVVLARSTSGAMRAAMDPVIRRMWELGTPGLVLSYPKEEGKFLGEAQPRQLPPGRAQLVTRREVRLVQTGLVGA
ncbi:secretion protein EccC [Amycolatopsis antarctica]|uniref:Secretion protein EccC n=1 Tax=Amycolatopsis antarctica TaxID=1854586 RepID=A0A263D116_9PSEU|nr:type VII secretion protein EccCa [Amycolatopsis antarctica]OZM72133.1 secretion protein EccC [Amycolatopsis antarctica]